MKQIERGMEPPTWFVERPEIEPHLQFHWEAFHELSTERQIGMAMGPIPRSAIKAYADEFAMTGDEFDEFNRIIRAVDNEYMGMIHEKKSNGKESITAPVDDLEATKAVFDVIKARAASANKRQVKRKPH
jgi:hypothetical protein